MRKYPSTYLYMPFEMIFVYPFITYQAGRGRAGVATKAVENQIFMVLGAAIEISHLAQYTTTQLTSYLLVIVQHLARRQEICASHLIWVSPTEANRWETRQAWKPFLNYSLFG